MANTRMFKKYTEEVRPALNKEFSYGNPHQVPAIKKVVVNIGVGDAKSDSKFIDAASNELGIITGQKPQIRKARKSIAGFKLREGAPIGCFVTLRGDRMWEFLDRLINVTLPRIKDFQGVSSKAFDGRGNYNLGLREQLIFSEINYDKVIAVRGMNISIVTSAQSDEEARALLAKLGMPFAR